MKVAERHPLFLKNRAKIFYRFIVPPRSKNAININIYKSQNEVDLENGGKIL
jgi:hypothetical protein